MPSRAFTIWRDNCPAEYQVLAEIDPDHLRHMEEGWSWIEHVGGPKDGARAYFVGAPNWRLTYVDPSVDSRHYKSGDPVHDYELRADEFGRAVYKWVGLRRGKAV